MTACCQIQYDFPERVNIIMIVSTHMQAVNNSKMVVTEQCNSEFFYETSV